MVDHTECQRQIGAGEHRQVKVHEVCRELTNGVDHGDERTAALRFSQIRNEVDVRRLRVGAPDEDRFRFDIVGKSDARHLAVHILGNGARGRRANRFREARSSQPGEKDAVDELIRHEAVRAAIVVGQDGLTAMLVSNRAQARRDLFNGFVPRNRRKRATSLGAHSTHGTQQPVLVIDALGETAHLGADEIVREGIAAIGGGIDLGDDAVLNGNFERARIRTIENAGGQQGLGAHSCRSASCSA